MKKQEVLNKIKGGLIVSCQALEDEPLHSSLIMGRMALAAKMGGAVGIRANTVEDIKEIRTMVDLPIIGIIKEVYDNSGIYITPTMKEVEKLINSDADIIAFDATLRKRPDDTKIEDIIRAIKAAGKIPMADISTFEEGIAAEKAGVEIVSTTLSGYTRYVGEQLVGHDQRVAGQKEDLLVERPDGILQLLGVGLLLLPGVDEMVIARQGGAHVARSGGKAVEHRDVGLQSGGDDALGIDAAP
jgi:N-acylglucosamine-6-phosphate 2-epimerase